LSEIFSFKKYCQNRACHAGEFSPSQWVPVFYDRHYGVSFWLQTVARVALVVTWYLFCGRLESMARCIESVVFCTRMTFLSEKQGKKFSGKKEKKWEDGGT